MYFAHSQFRFWGSQRATSRMNLVAASALPTDQLRSEVERVVQSLDPGLPLTRFRKIEEIRRASVAVPRLLTQAVSSFALVALALAAIGIYGVMSQWVGLRIPELGIRSALGAQRPVLAWMIFREGLRLTATGIICGIVIAFGFARAIEGILFGVSPADSITFGTVPLVLAIAALGACYLPVRRALSIDPAHLLRSL